ncbi:MAG: protein phosphatase 2C domain-containing protein [Oscillospiraceae bacterium]|nr:protein phosphatase 2C domain-containing protein [Oscillospiraceae bacterium]
MVSIISASVCGAAHKLKGQECQDSFAAEQFGDVTLIAVADGHGSESCPHSRAGADLAVEVFVRVMRKYFALYSREPDTLRDYLQREGSRAVARAIEHDWKQRVSQKSSDIAAYGTTLLGLVLTPMFYFAYRLGDGDLIEVSQNSSQEIVRGNKQLGVATYSLCHPNASDYVLTKVGESKANTAYIVATDGFANSYPDEDGFNRTCLDYCAAIREHGANTVNANLPDWLEETSREGSGDDITVIIANL